MKKKTTPNPRWRSGRRRVYQQRFRAMQAPCGICHGKILGEINYDSSDPKDPRSFVIDEIIPISRWREAGYESPQAAADDWNNVRPAHRWCNAMKGNKMNFSIEDLQRKVPKKIKKNIILDGDW